MSRSIAIAVALGAAATLAAAGWALRADSRRAAERVQGELAAVADLARLQVDGFLAEPRAEIKVLSRSRTVREADTWLAAGGREGEESRRIRELLATYARAYDYLAVSLLDGEGNVVLSTPAQVAESPDARALAKAAIASEDLTLGQVRRDPHAPERPLLLDIFLPVRMDGVAAPRVRLVQLRVDLLHALPPLAKHWTEHTPGARARLATRLGNSLLMVGLAPGATDRVAPIGDDDTLEAAVARRVDGPFAGKDADGRRVVASLRAVAGTPWSVVAELDAEAASPFAVAPLFVALPSLFALALGAWLLRRRLGRAESAEARAAAQVEAMQLQLDGLIAAMPVAYVRMGPGLVVRKINAAAVSVLGLPDAAAVLGKPMPSDLYDDPAERGRFAAAVRANGQHRGQLRIRRRSGGVSLVEGIGRMLRMPDGSDDFELIALDLTELIRAEVKLRENERELQGIFDNMQDAFLSATVEGRILRINPAAARFLGYTEEELLTKNTAQDIFADPGERATLKRMLLEHGRVELFRARWKRKDGEIRVIEGNVQLVRGPDGEPVRLEGVSRDVTDRDRALEKLRRSEAQLAEAQALARLGRFEVDYQRGGVVTWSDEMYRLFGAERGEVPDVAAVMNRCHPDDREPLRQAIAEAREKHSSFAFDHRIVMPSGEVRHVHSRGTPEVDHDGRLLRMVGTVQDITERKEEEERTRALLAALPDLMLQTDAAGTCIESHAPESGVLSGSSSRWLARTFGELFPTAADMFREAMAMARETGEVQPLEYWAEQKGERCCFEARVAALQGGGFLAVVRDVTGRRRTEEELIRAREEALEAARAKAQFLANMSHEIRTPMNAIVGLSHLMTRMELPGKQREYLESIQSSARSLLGLTNDILDFSKLEAGKVRLESVPFALERVLRDVADQVGLRAEEKGLKLGFRVGENVPQLLVGDPLRLSQVLVNLASNGVKFTERGEVSLAVERAGGDGATALLRFEVKDTGIGLDSEAQRRLFAPFVQADGSTSRRYGGTGLGLAICRELVAQMGGTIGLDSEPGRGSRFHFTVPLAIQEAGAAERKPAAERAPAARSSALEGLTILVVDDNEINRRVAEEILLQAGAEVQTAADGTAALKALSQARFSAVLLDVQMPGMDGYETARAIRRDERLRGLPVLAVTAHALEDERARCLAAGMDDYLYKPVDPEALVQKLVRWGRPSLQASHIDAAGALRRLGGRERIFAELLGMFQRDYSGAGAAVRAALARHDREAARATVHSLRGVAATLGAVQLSSAAAALEAALRDSTRGHEALVEGFDGALAAALGEAAQLQAKAGLER